MSESPPLNPIMLDISCPNCALNVHDDTWNWTVQLDHHNWTQICSLVSVGEVKSWKASERGVGHLKSMDIVKINHNMSNKRNKSILYILIKSRIYIEDVNYVLTGPMFSLSGESSPSQ